MVSGSTTTGVSFFCNFPFLSIFFTNFSLSSFNFAGWCILLIYFTTKKIEKEIIKKLTIAVMKFPYLIETSPTVNIILEKSIFPVIMEIQGIIISSTREETIFWNAAPITTPIAKSITFPFIANCLNSFNI